MGGGGGGKWWVMCLGYCFFAFWRQWGRNGGVGSGCEVVNALGLCLFLGWLALRMVVVAWEVL